MPSQSKVQNLPSPLRTLAAPREKHRLRRVIARALLIASIATGLGASSAGAANVTSAKPLFSSATPSSYYIGPVQPWSTVDLSCWRDSVWYNGTNRWFLVAAWVWSSSTGRYVRGSGWLSANHVANQHAVRRC